MAENRIMRNNLPIDDRAHHNIEVDDSLTKLVGLWVLGHGDNFLEAVLDELNKCRGDPVRGLFCLDHIFLRVELKDFRQA